VREPGPGVWVGPGIFRLADADKDGSLTRAELKGAFSRWVDDWAEEAAGALTEEALAGGLRATLSREDFVVVAGAPGGPNTDPGRPEPGPNRPDPGSNRQGVAPGPGGPGGPPGTGAGPGFGGGGPRVNGVELDPLVAANDANKPLLSRLLAVPALRERYLRYVRDIAETWLDWNKLGPIAERYHALIADDVKVDTRKLDTTEEFAEGLAGEAQPAPGPGPRGALSLKSFAEQRRAYLLKYEEKK
jgi:hypothetical protein